MGSQKVYGASGTSWELRRATYLLPVMLTVFTRDASQVFGTEEKTEITTHP
jgi:hypothetical protein